MKTPPSPMLARSELALPRGDGWLYEPKWDGFRALVRVARNGVRIFGRNGGSLEHSFPEICRGLQRVVGPGTTLDGEIVVFKDGRLDFPSLLGRAGERPPATYIGFDILERAAQDVSAKPFVERRKLLELTLPAGDVSCVTTQTSDAAAAEGWLDELAEVGLEGIVAKRASDRYRPGKRGWVKVRRFETLDAVVGGYRGTDDGADSLLLGLFDDDGTFRYIGQTVSLPARDRARVARVLDALTADTSFNGRTMPGTGRWEGARFDAWVPVEPVLVCEVSFSRIDHGFLRHPARIVRWRPDKDARECTVAV
jgi:ATP-dependent DNA ligase